MALEIHRLRGGHHRKVLISVTAVPPAIHPEVAIFLCKLPAATLPPAADCSIDLTVPSVVPYENALHQVIREVLAGGYSWWLNIDADNPPRCNPLELISLDLDVVGCPTPVWHWTRNKEYPIYLNAYRYVPEAGAYREYPAREGLHQVDAVGTGCVLIARRVLEDPRMRTGCFLRKLEPDGVVERGNDISFCERAGACGFRIWAHYDYPCNHYPDRMNLLDLGVAFQTWRANHVE